MNQPFTKRAWRIQPVYLVIASALLCGAGNVLANSCLMERADAGRLEGNVGHRDLLSIGKVAITPCEGRIAGGDALILHSKGGGITQVTLVKAGLDLKDAIPRPLHAIALPGGLLGSFWTSLTAPRPTRPGSKRFDDAQGLPMGGQVLVGQALWIPLARFGWDPVATVRVATGNQSVTLTPKDGLVLIPSAMLTAGDASLRQGQRSAALEVVGLDAFAGLQAQIEHIDTTSADQQMRWLRQTILLFEWGLILNAADADIRMSR